MLETVPGVERFTPIYYRIQEAVRHRIVSGAARPGERLPSESELARDFGTTRLTVRHALTRLVYDGLITRHPGRGTFVAQPASVVSHVDTLKCHSFEQQVALDGRRVEYRVLSYRTVAAPADVARRLGLPVKAGVYRLERLRRIGARVVGLELRHFPAGLGKQVTPDMLARRAAYDFLCEILGEPIPTIEVSLTAMPAPTRLAVQLGVAPGSAVMVRDHVFRDGRARVVQCGKSSFPGDIRMDYVLGQTVTPMSGD